MTTTRVARHTWFPARRSLKQPSTNSAFATKAGASHFCVADKDLTAPPGSCADGACYIIAATATGAWAGKETRIATAVGNNAASGSGAGGLIDASV